MLFALKQTVLFMFGLIDIDIVKDIKQYLWQVLIYFSSGYICRLLCIRVVKLVYCCETGQEPLGMVVNPVKNLFSLFLHDTLKPKIIPQIINFDMEIQSNLD